MKYEKPPEVSVIIVNWNGERFLRPCLDALIAQVFNDFEIIVIDNGSTDGSIALIETNYSEKIRLYKNNNNLGFSEGNNRGITLAQSRFIATLNTDTVADPYWLFELVAQTVNNPQIGMWGSKILLIDKPDTIDSVGVNIYPDGMSRQRGHLEPDDGRYTSVEEILVPSACAALYRKTMLDEIGLFDPDFFAYCEDTDLGLRGRIAGWKAVIVPSARVYHHYSGTSGKFSALKAYFVERNHFWLALKIMPPDMLAMVPLFSIIRLWAQCWDIFTFSARARKKGNISIHKGNILAAVLRAYIAMIAGTPGILRKRAQIQALKRISNNEIRSFFKRFRLQIRNLRLDN